MTFLLFLVFCIVGAASTSNIVKYDSIYSFGDSLADTGNFLRSGALAFPVIGKLPYGETFFGHPTGRCSDGRLVIDFIAEAYGLPYVPPYLSLAEGQTSKHGVNFAVAGATALDAKFFIDKGVGRILWTKDSLSVQLGWFKKFKSTLCNTTKEGCNSYFNKALFLMGEIGGNDYTYPFLAGASIKDMRALVALVVKTIVGATTMLIKEGAMDLMVPGNLPIGCSAAYLTLFKSPNKTDYDQNGCLKVYNAFSKYHNSQLKLALVKLRQKYPQAKIMYADNYGAAKRMFHSPLHHGFLNGVTRACCGGGGPYNFNNSARCGHIGSIACKSPSTYANWDGMHLTEAAYKHMAMGLMNGTYTSPPLSSI